MALAAVRELVGEEEHPAEFLLAAQGRRAAQKAVVLRVERRERLRPLGGGDRLRQRLEGSFGIVEDSRPERLLKGGPVGFALPQPGRHRRPVGHAHLGGVQRRLKRKAAARRSLEEALAILEATGAPLWAERARAELARIGGRTRAGGLTPTEERVADLVAEGRSNKEVADALFVSVRTVEANLTRIYAKLGVRSRTELASRRGR